MKDIVHHIENDDLVALRPRHYNNLTRGLYIIIRRAFLDGADTLCLNADGLVWEQDNRQLGEHPYPNLPSMQRSYRDGFYRILKYDEIVRACVTIASDTRGEIVCKLDRYTPD